MSYVCVIDTNTKMIKKDIFSPELQKLSEIAKAISHPARLAILIYLAETKTCISGDISNHIPLSRSTVSQHLKELKAVDLIHGEIEGLKINYCLCKDNILNFEAMMNDLFTTLKSSESSC